MKRFSISLIFLLLSISATADYPDFSELVDEAAPAVVNVSVIKTISTQNRMSPFNRRQNPFDDFFNFPFPFEDEPRREQEREVRSGGSGFIISKDGFIITNHHVVEDASQIFVSLNDRREFIAELIGSDKKSDVALLKISAKESLPFLDLGDSDNVDVGDWVLAIGSPYRLNFSVTAGIISAKARSVPGQGTSYIPFLQSDVAINQGNSGGPLFNLEGDVIGINSQILSSTGGSNGISFSIPSNVAMNVIEQLRESGVVERGLLGVRMREVDFALAEIFGMERPRGAFVDEVQPQSPAARGGIQNEDIILEFNGERIQEMKELPIIVARTEVGKKVKVKIWRNKKEITKTITLGRLETSEDFKVAEKNTPLEEQKIESLKITVRKLSREDIKTRNLPNQTSGLVITQIDNNSPLANSIEVNSIILEAQKKKIKSSEDLNQAVKKVLESNQKTILLVIYNSQNQRRYIGIKLD